MEGGLHTSVPREPAWRADGGAILLVNLSRAANHAQRLRGILESAPPSGFRVFEESADPLPRAVERIDPAVVFLLLRSNQIAQAAEAVRSLANGRPQRPVIPVVEAGDPQGVLSLLASGAADFLIPPLSAADVLPRLWRLLGTLPRPLDGVKAKVGLQQLVGGSPAFSRLLEKIPLVATCDVTVTIYGETGTGKELVSRAIHYLSARSRHGFIPLNCGAIPAELAEAELFGCERGAFTGATAFRAGLIAEAEGGTLFLDEIDCLPGAVQVKLLRFLQEKEYRPLGSTRMRTADVRIVAATNADVDAAVESGQLRRDLYYRLNVVSLTLPPLRERREDVALLATHFVAKHAARLRRPARGLSADAVCALTAYDWPGNVRELENIIERAVVLSERATLTEADLLLPSAAPRHAVLPQSFRQAKAHLVGQFERAYLEDLLSEHRGNITSAARAAGKDRRALFELLRKHAIDAGRFRRAKGE